MIQPNGLGNRTEARRLDDGTCAELLKAELSKDMLRGSTGHFGYGQTIPAFDCVPETGCDHSLDNARATEKIQYPDHKQMKRAS